MGRWDRRSILKLAGTTPVVSALGGLAGILASGRAPAYAQGTTLHWLRWNDFVPASDQLLRQSLLPEAGKALGIKINLETVNGNDLQPRITAGIQSGSGPDLVMLFNNHPHLYAASVTDLSDVAEAIGKAQGGFYGISKGNCNDGSKWIAMPFVIIASMIAYRKSWFAEIGVEAFPETWEQYAAAGKKLKAKGRPIGQSLAHSFGDPPTFCYPLLWSFGGKELENDGKTVAINSKETVDSVKYMSSFWKDGHDEGGLAWDDTGNNRAFLAGTIAATLNGASIYLEAVRKPDVYQTEKGTPLKDDILHSPLPSGAAGRFGLHTFHSHVLPTYSKNQKPAKDFLTWMHTSANYEKWFTSQKGFATGTTLDWEKSPVWDIDPVMAPFRTAGRAGQLPGFGGPPSVKAAEALSKYIVTDMYAKAAQGMAAEDAVKWCESELKKIYVA